MPFATKLGFNVGEYVSLEECINIYCQNFIGFYGRYIDYCEEFDAEDEYLFFKIKQGLP